MLQAVDHQGVSFQRLKDLLDGRVQKPDFLDDPFLENSRVYVQLERRGKLLQDHVQVEDVVFVVHAPGHAGCSPL